jgi:hypothetical protein
MKKVLKSVLLATVIMLFGGPVMHLISMRDATPAAEASTSTCVASGRKLTSTEIEAFNVKGAEIESVDNVWFVTHMSRRDDGSIRNITTVNWCRDGHQQEQAI